MMAPWPCIKRGTEWLVPIVPGLVKVMVVPAKSSTVSRPARAFFTICSYAVPELGEVQRLAALDAGHQKLASAILLRQVDRQAEIDVRGYDERRLAVDDVVAVVHGRDALQGLHHRVADEVGVGDLAAARTS